MSEKSGTVRIDPISVNPGMRISVLTDRDIETIHQATLTILEKTGVRFPSERALRAFADTGAEVDFNNHTVRIPPDLLMKTIAIAPRAFTMASRGDPGLDLLLDGTKTYVGTDGTGTTTVDFETRKRRASTKRDVAMMALISDYLPSISFYWPMVSAQDVPPPVRPLHELEASFTNTEKHIHIISCIEPKTARYGIEMATLIAGGSEPAKRRPPLSLLVCATSPLTQHEGSLDTALAFAEAGLPVLFCAMPIVGSTGPASMAGTMVMGNAEILSGLCLIQILYPRAPVCYVLFHDLLNPLTGECWTSGPQGSVFQAGSVELGHYYNLPVMSGYGGTDAHEPETWQAGKDYAVDALFSFLTGPELMVPSGLLETATLLHPEKMLFDNETLNSVKAMTKGLRVDSETGAIDEIMDVGPGGHFLDRDFTCKNLRELWQPGIAHQWSPQRGDFRDPREAAVEKVKWILENHQPPPLDEKVKIELEKLLKTAGRELVS
jgi:trimethylamine--corrinoid protein Co-methyltransferase